MSYTIPFVHSVAKWKKFFRCETTICKGENLLNLCIGSVGPILDTFVPLNYVFLVQITNVLNIMLTGDVHPLTYCR